MWCGYFEAAPSRLIPWIVQSCATWTNGLTWAGQLGLVHIVRTQRRHIFDALFAHRTYAIPPKSYPFSVYVRYGWTPTAQKTHVSLRVINHWRIWDRTSVLFFQRPQEHVCRWRQGPGLQLERGRRTGARRRQPLGKGRRRRQLHLVRRQVLVCRAETSL